MGCEKHNSTREYFFQQHFAITEVGDDHVGPDREQALPFPFVDATGAVVRFVAGHRHSEATKQRAAELLQVPYGGRRRAAAPSHKEVGAGS